MLTANVPLCLEFGPTLIRAFQGLVNTSLDSNEIEDHLQRYRETTSSGVPKCGIL